MADSRTALLPFDAVLFDLDGVLTSTAKIHAACWKSMFDDFLRKHAVSGQQPFTPFDIEDDYTAYVDGKPRYEGVRSFLESRSIALPYGSPADDPVTESVQEQHIVPIVEPEVLMYGAHKIERCEEVTGLVLHAVFHALFEQGVWLESMLLKPSMVIPGKDCSRQASVREVATATLRCLRRQVPAAVPGIVFLSGGQKDKLATEHLNAINRLPGPKPWKLSFSYGRALQDQAMAAWQARDENLKAGQQAFHHRARCNGAATRGEYSDEIEAKPVNAPG